MFSTVLSDYVQHTHQGWESDQLQWLCQNIFIAFEAPFQWDSFCTTHAVVVWCVPFHCFTQASWLYLRTHYTLNMCKACSSKPHGLAVHVGMLMQVIQWSGMLWPGVQSVSNHMLCRSYQVAQDAVCQQVAQWVYTIAHWRAMQVIHQVAMVAIMYQVSIVSRSMTLYYTIIINYTIHMLCRSYQVAQDSTYTSRWGSDCTILCTNYSTHTYVHIYLHSHMYSLWHYITHMHM